MACSGQRDEVIPKGGRSDRRVLRGGSWNNNPRNCRCANRNDNAPDNRNNNIGFRVVLRPGPSTPRTRGGWSPREARAGRSTDCPGVPSRSPDCPPGRPV
ncbi:MAG: SUMF1/EgtB/PvdO family nonheme iron enzyme [Planctomycetes bacterium]|nr:SUMF1/EgtB/PvdO family nonheme iron enzyme [Planctomycetota bacterium]